MTERRAAIVTGGSRGIGRAIALELARLQHDVVINHVSPPNDALAQTQQAVEAQGVRCLTVQANVGDTAGRDKLVAAAKDAFGRCDLLVNNAGVAPKERKNILETTEESYDRVLEINLKGPFFLTQLVANWMIEQRQSHAERPMRIINIGSVSAYTTSPERGEYCISKAGLGMVTQLFAHQLAESAIGVFEIRPGIIATDMTSAVHAKYDTLITDGLTPIKRWGQPEDVARAVAAIAEGALDFSTGEVINVDGGFHMKRL